MEKEDMIMENSKMSGISVLFSAVALVLSVIAVIVCINVSGRTKAQYDKAMKTIEAAASTDEQTEKIEQPPKQDEQAAAIVSEPKYIIKTENGFVVAKDNDGNTVRSLNMPEFLLSADDREALSVGVEIYSEEELTSYIMDLCN